MTDLEIRQLGNYRLLRLLGEGGYADVYLGEHIHLGRLAAVKVLRLRLHEADRQAFHTEARIIARLDHPHIIKVSDYGIEHDYPYFVMEYAPQGTLRGRHPQGSILPLETVVAYARQIGDALQYAHDNKVVHRDVKPENMLIKQDGSLVLSDFGIAVGAHGTGTRTPQNEAGTARYMAPECFRDQAERASDQYSLAVVTYEWLCGTPPFEGENIYQLAYQHMGAPPPPLRRRTQALSPGVEAILQIALAKDPRQRYESVRAFTQTLAACMNPVATVPASPNGKTMPDTSLPMAPPTMLVPPQPGMVQLPPDKKKQPQALFRVSRRTLLRDVLAGTGGTVALAAIEGLVYWRLHLPPPTPIYVYRGHTDAVQMVKWSPDGTTIASGGNDKRILVWRADMKSASRAAWGTGVTVYGGHSDIIRDLAWSSSGKYIASASDDMTVQIWDATNSQNVLTYRKHPGHVYGVAWSNDDKLIVSGSSDRSVQIWNTQTGGIIATYLADNNVQKVAWSPDNKQIAVATADRVDILNFANGKLNYLLTYSGHGGLTVDQVAWSPNGQELASASSDQTMHVWDARTATTVFSSPAFNNSVWGVAWSPNSQYLAAASKDKSLQVWQMANGTWNRIVTNGANNFITSVNWSPNSRYYAAGVFDATVQIWDLTQE